MKVRPGRINCADVSCSTNEPTNNRLTNQLIINVSPETSRLHHVREAPDSLEKSF